MVKEKDLLKATESGDLELVSTLVDNGLNADARDDYGTTALMVAGLWNRYHIAEYLLAMGAKVNSEDKFFHATALYFAALAGNVKIVRLLLQSGALPDARTRVGGTALMVASRGNHLEAAEVLLSHGATISFKDKRGFTALLEASRENCTEVVGLLLSQGADPNAGDEDDRTPLFWATVNGNLSSVRLLLDSGARPDVPDRNGRTPLLCAYVKRHLEVASLLLRAWSANQLTRVSAVLATINILPSGATRFLYAFI
jgi:ankyrin repeat protein